MSVDELASSPTLLAGRRVLLREGVRCHDLRTILLKPKTAKGWRETVRRMADRSVVLDPIAENQQWAVTSYLIAISPNCSGPVPTNVAMSSVSSLLNRQQPPPRPGSPAETTLRYRGRAAHI